MKIKFMLPVITLILMTIACNNKHQYTINGHLDADGFNGTTIYLYDNTTERLIDSAILTDGTFSFTGDVKEPLMARLVTKTNDNGQSYYGICFVETGNIYIDLFSDSLSGTPMNDAYYKFNNDVALKQRQHQLSELYSQYLSATNSTTRSAIEKQYDSVETLASAELKQKAQTLYEGNRENILGAFAFNVVAQQINDAESLSKQLASVAPIIKNFKPTQERLTQLQNIDHTAVGMHFADINGVDFATGKASKLSTMINGKLALVDFWASWCGPCRKEISDNLIPLYEKYKGKGLLVIGVDVNDKMSAHATAVKTLGITYPQLLDTANVACPLYGINGIPHIMLVAADGTILARDLRGNDVEIAIIEALKK